MEYEKDYSLLRPFDFEAAKRGDGVISIHSPECKGTFVGGPDCNGIIVLNRYPLGFSFWGPIEQTESLRMAPLAWVEGKPVYKGDEPYYMGNKRRVTGMVSGFVEIDGSGGVLVPLEELTWTTPKVKREGWIAIKTSERPKGDKYTHLCSHICATEQLARDHYGSSTDVIVAPVSWEEPVA